MCCLLLRRLLYHLTVQVVELVRDKRTERCLLCLFTFNKVSDRQESLQKCERRKRVEERRYIHTHTLMYTLWTLTHTHTHTLCLSLQSCPGNRNHDSVLVLRVQPCRKCKEVTGELTHRFTHATGFPHAVF